MKLEFLNEDHPIAQPDPYIFSYRDTYYLYTTGFDGVHCYKADDLFGPYKYAGRVLEEQGKKEYWAPCIYEENGVFYIYYSRMDRSSDDCHTETICVATSERPDGEFTFRKELVAPFAIDPHVVKSGAGLYMFYSVNDYEAERAGTYIVVQKMKNPLEMEGEAFPVLRPTLDEEIFQKDRFRKGQHWHTLEGAYYFRKDDYHYIMYSGNCYQNENYYIGYAVAKGDTDDLTKLKFRKYPNESTYAPLLRKSDTEEGTGHNSVLLKNGKYYVFYHGRDYDLSEKDNDVRTARVREMTVGEGTLKML